MRWLLPRQTFIRRQRQELDEIGAYDQPLENLGGFRIVSTIEPCRAETVAHCVKLLGNGCPDKFLRHRAAILHANAVTKPLPHLGAADLRGRCVFHQVIDRNAPESAEPRLQVLDADIDVMAQSFFGDLTFVNSEQIA